MLTPNRITSNIPPTPFEDLGNGNWYYNFDIKEQLVTIHPFDDNEDDYTETQYNYIQVKMSGKPTYKRCVELIIAEFITQSQEFDLINSYNRVSLNLLSNDTQKDIDNYKEYLDKVQEIKDKVKKDFE